MFKSTQFFIQTLCIIFAVSPCFHSEVTAQSPVECNIAGHSYIIPDFEEDSVVSFNNSFVNIGAVTSLRQSQAMVEVRIYSWRKWGRPFDNVFIISFISGKVSCIWTSILLKWVTDKKDMRDLGWQLFKTDSTVNYYKFVTCFDVLISPGVLTDSLISNNLFALKDEIKLVNHLQSTGTVVNDPCRGVDDCFADDSLLVEIKAGDKLRNFRIKALDYGRTNPAIEGFVPYSSVKHFIYALMYTNKWLKPVEVKAIKKP